MLLSELFGNIPGSMPLYHFTTLRNFYSIVQSDQLTAAARTDQIARWSGQKAVSFTRDPRRTFMASNVSQAGIGFRVDRNRLSSNYKNTPHAYKSDNRTDPDKFKRLFGDHFITDRPGVKGTYGNTNIDVGYGPVVDLIDRKKR